MSNGPITTRFEERVNKELARLGNDGDVQAFLARLVRAFVDTIGELEARRELSPTVEALRETIEIIDVSIRTPPLITATTVQLVPATRGT